MGMDVYGRKPTSKAGEYFRASVWSWRPIHALCETVLQRQLPSWGYNDGQGFKTQAECDVLADKLEHYLKHNHKDAIEIESDLRVGENNQFLPKGDPGGRSAYSTNQEHVREFITFLRACGGFKIYGD